MKKEKKLRGEVEEKLTQEILPLRDFVIFQNGLKIILKEGELVEVPTRFLENLKTEKVI